VNPGDEDTTALLDLEETFAELAVIVSEGRAAFDASRDRQLACVLLVGRVGEIARERLSDELKEGHPDVPWSDIIKMRDLLYHRYHRIDFDEVWGAMARHVPELRGRLADDIEAARARYGAADDGWGEVVRDRARQSQEARDQDGRSARTWEPHVPRCGSTDTEDGRPCRNPSPPGRRCWRHSN
jgi:uncharacterized protein with HEPN domain